MKEKKLTIRLPEGLHKKLKLYCVGKDKSINDMVKEIIEKKLKEAE